MTDTLVWTGTLHRIRRQRWVVQIRAGSAQDAFIWRKFLHDEGQDLLLPLLEKAFNEAVGGGAGRDTAASGETADGGGAGGKSGSGEEANGKSADTERADSERAGCAAASGERVIHIPRIELKIALNLAEQKPDVRSDIIPQQLREQLREELKEQIREQISGQLREQLQEQLREQLQSVGREQAQPSGQESGHSAAGQGSGRSDWPRPVHPEGPGQSAGQPAWRKESTAQRHRFDVLLHYLRTGSVPWEAANASAPDNENARLLMETCRREWPQLLDHLRNRPQSTPFYFRLLQLLPKEEYGPLLKALSEIAPKAMQQGMTQEVLQEMLQGMPQGMLQEMLRGTLQGTPQGMLQEMLQGMPQETRITVTKCITLLLDPACTSSYTPGYTVLSRYARLRIAASLLSQSVKWREGPAPDIFSSALSFASPEERQAFQDLLASLREPFAALLQHRKTPEGDRDNRDTGSCDTPVTTKEISGGSSSSATTAGLTKNGNSLSPRIPDEVSVASLHSSADECLFHDHPVKGTAVSGRLSEHSFPLLVHQAGLIILHPFITRLFENTKIIEKGMANISPFALARSAALLHFLAVGDEKPDEKLDKDALDEYALDKYTLDKYTLDKYELDKYELDKFELDKEIYEYELDFIKVLLGLNPETPLPVCGGLLHPGDQEEAESLLGSVIEHWSILKNSSIQGLRSSFLQRQALLREDEYGWNLHVERKPFDMLLEHLPWSISIVKLPWMKKALYAEW
jgi:hypothetical protein